jgi:uncharacterized OsmC-like protein
MSEKIMVQMNSRFETKIFAAPDEDGELGEMAPVEGRTDVTPYGMLLAGLASCTGIVVQTFAQNRGLALEEVELQVVYERDFQEDCLNCETINEYPEIILEEITFRGALSEADRARLYQVSKQCPIHKMLEKGVPIRSEERQD